MLKILLKYQKLNICNKEFPKKNKIQQLKFNDYEKLHLAEIFLKWVSEIPAHLKKPFMNSLNTVILLLFNLELSSTKS